MPARVWKQSREMWAVFGRRIAAKKAREEYDLEEEISRAMPFWLAPAIRPLSVYRHRKQIARNAVAGRSGENWARFVFWLFLGRRWSVVNDVVLEVTPGEFIQVDHVLIGPPGIFLIETKAWRGDFAVTGDTWTRRIRGRRSMLCDSPTIQHERHANLFRQWLLTVNLGRLCEYVRPVILFGRARSLKVHRCSMPIYRSAAGLALDLRRREKAPVLAPEEVSRVASAIAGALPLAESRFPAEKARAGGLQSPLSIFGMAAAEIGGRMWYAIRAVALALLALVAFQMCVGYLVAASRAVGSGMEPTVQREIAFNEAARVYTECLGWLRAAVR